jgi:serine/threonine protein kinase
MEAAKETRKVFAGFDLQTTLGKGAQAKVKYAVELTSGAPYAIKLFFQAGEMEAEIKNLEGLRHPNIVNVLSSGTAPLIKRNGSIIKTDYVV